MNDESGRYRPIHGMLLQYSRLLIEWALEVPDDTRRPAALIRRTSDGPMLPDDEPLLDESPGVFVTLRMHDELRGCIGAVHTDKPLRLSLRRLTLDAAFRDSRFAPLERAELPLCRIEHSFLSSLHAIDAVDAVELGRHGIVFNLGGRRAVYLPEVPIEQGWDLATTLAALCRKAGAAADAWRDPAARFAVFQTEHYADPHRE